MSLVGSFILFIYYYYLLFFTDLSQTSDCLAGQVHEGVSVALVMSVMGIFFLLLLLLLCVASCDASIWRVRGQHARGAKEAKSKKEAPFLKRKKSRDLRENESERASERDPHTHGATRAFLYLLYAFIGPRGSLLFLFFWSWSSSSSPLGPRSRELPPFIDPATRPNSSKERGARSEERNANAAACDEKKNCKMQKDVQK